MSTNEEQLPAVDEDVQTQEIRQQVAFHYDYVKFSRTRYGTEPRLCLSEL